MINEELSMKYKKVFVWSVITALGGFLFGFDTAVISGVEKTIQSVFALSPVQHGLVISSALIGTVIGAIFASRPADKWGRRPVLIAIALLYLLSAVGCAFSNGPVLLFIFRLIGGFGVGASSVVAPMYISEISPANVRGRMTAMFQLNVITGMLVAYTSNWLLYDALDNAWRMMLGVEGVPAFLFFLLLFRVPESPRFLLMKSRKEEAKKVLQTIDASSVEENVIAIEEDILQASRQGGKLFVKAYRKPIMIAFLVAMFNQFCGINAVLYYAARIFESSGLSSGDSLFHSVIVGAVNFAFTLVGTVLIDKVGRKKLLFIGSVGMTVCLATIAFVFYSATPSPMLLLISLLVYIAFFAMSTGAVIWVIISEVFPNQIRGKGQSFGSFTHWSLAALITFCFPIIANVGNVGLSATFLFFAIMMVFQAIFAKRWLPETSCRSLEEIGKNL